MMNELGTFEQLILSAIVFLGENAYGMTIQEKLEELMEGRQPSVGGIYSTINRLEQKGLITSTYGGATATRGGRSKRFVKLTFKGQQILHKSLRLWLRVASALEFPLVNEG